MSATRRPAGLEALVGRLGRLGPEAGLLLVCAREELSAAQAQRLRELCTAVEDGGLLVGRCDELLVLPNMGTAQVHL